MPQDTMPALFGLDSFERLEKLLAARRVDGSPEATMTFEAFEVELAQVMRRFENELKAADLARYDVDAEAIMGEVREDTRTDPAGDASAGTGAAASGTENVAPAGAEDPDEDPDDAE